MSHDNSTFERMSRQSKFSKPPHDGTTSKDAKRVRERKEQSFQRTDKRQQWQEVEF
jgi:hypothetical protein